LHNGHLILHDFNSKGRLPVLLCLWAGEKEIYVANGFSGVQQGTKSACLMEGGDAPSTVLAQKATNEVCMLYFDEGFMFMGGRERDLYVANGFSGVQQGTKSAGWRRVAPPFLPPVRPLSELRCLLYDRQ
jgi:hypothetical protein